MHTRIVLVVLAALLALPIAQTASPVEAKKRSRTVTKTFHNAAPLNLPITSQTVVSAGLYPSTIAVDGLKGKIRDVNVRLNNLSHTYPRDLEVLLVGPGGQTAIVMAYAGESFDIDDATLTLDDEAAVSLPILAEIQSGAFLPTNNRGRAIDFNAPAPATSANAALSVYDGGSPNGTWRLFVQDIYGPADSGVFVDGWGIEITTKVKAKKKKR